MSNSLLIHGLQPARLLCLQGSPGKTTGVGCHFLHQGIFPIQRLNPSLYVSCTDRQVLYWWRQLGSPSLYGFAYSGHFISMALLLLLNLFSPLDFIQRLFQQNPKKVTALNQIGTILSFYIEGKLCSFIYKEKQVNVITIK